MAPFSGGFRSYNSNFNDFLIAVMILLTKLFRMALIIGVIWPGLKSNAPFHLFSKIVLPPLISYALKAKNTCSCIIQNINAWLSIWHKEIEFRADHGNVKFAQTRSEAKRSKPSPTRSQPKEMRPKQSSLLARKLSRPQHQLPTSK